MTVLSPAELQMHIGFIAQRAAEMAVKNKSRLSDCMPAALAQYEALLERDADMWDEPRSVTRERMKEIETELKRQGFRVA